MSERPIPRAGGNPLPIEGQQSAPSIDAPDGSRVQDVSLPPHAARMVDGLPDTEIYTLKAPERGRFDSQEITSPARLRST